MVRHQNAVHNNRRPFQCKECDLTFKRPQHLKAHVTSAHPVIPSPRSTRSQKDADKTNDSTEVITFTCNFCPKSFESEAGLVCHKRQAHKREYEEDKKVDKFECNVCSKSYVHKDSLRRHERRRRCGKMLRVEVARVRE